MNELSILEKSKVICTMEILFPKTLSNYRRSSTESKPIEFLVDTGADSSSIGKSYLYDLGYSLSWIKQFEGKYSRRVGVASGEIVEGVKVPLRGIKVLGLEGVNFPMGVLLDSENEMPRASCAGCKYTGTQKRDFANLMGNDLLQCFEFSSDREKGVLRLKPVKEIPNIEPIFEGQSLKFIEEEGSKMEKEPKQNTFIAGGRDSAVKEIINEVYGIQITPEQFKKVTTLLPESELESNDPFEMAWHCCRTVVPRVMGLESVPEEKVKRVAEEVQRRRKEAYDANQG